MADRFDYGRVYLTVPFVERDQAKAHGARWDAVLGRWWIARRDLVAHSTIHRWIADPKLAAEVQAAHLFLKADGATTGRSVHPKDARHSKAREGPLRVGDAVPAVGRPGNIRAQPSPKAPMRWCP